jgi:hypothetical protein
MHELRRHLACGSAIHQLRFISSSNFAMAAETHYYSIRSILTSSAIAHLSENLVGSKLHFSTGNEPPLTISRLYTVVFLVGFRSMV